MEIKTFDLENRTLTFSRNIIRLVKEINKDAISLIILKKLIRSGTSVGANYREANETKTPRDFKYRINIAKKEAKETIYWLELLGSSETARKDLEVLMNEAQELVKILGSIQSKWTV